MTSLFIISGIVAVPFIAALFVRKDYKISRSINIQRKSIDVYNYVKYLKHQDAYSKWVMADPTKQTEFRGEDGRVGFVYAWNGNSKAGKGEQEIIELTEGHNVNCEIRFEKPMKTVSYTTMKTEANGDNTTLTWEMKGRSSYPINFANIFLMGILEKDLVESLENLKRILEK